MCYYESLSILKPVCILSSSKNKTGPRALLTGNILCYHTPRQMLWTVMEARDKERPSSTIARLVPAVRQHQAPSHCPRSRGRREGGGQERAAAGGCAITVTTRSCHYPYELGTWQCPYTAETQVFQAKGLSLENPQQGRPQGVIQGEGAQIRNLLRESQKSFSE